MRPSDHKRAARAPRVLALAAALAGLLLIGACSKDKSVD